MYQQNGDLECDGDVSFQGPQDCGKMSHRDELAMILQFGLFEAARG